LADPDPDPPQPPLGNLPLYPIDGLIFFLAHGNFFFALRIFLCTPPIFSREAFWRFLGAVLTTAGLGLAGGLFPAFLRRTFAFFFFFFFPFSGTLGPLPPEAKKKFCFLRRQLLPFSVAKDWFVLFFSGLSPISLVDTGFAKKGVSSSLHACVFLNQPLLLC